MANDDRGVPAPPLAPGSGTAQQEVLDWAWAAGFKAGRQDAWDSAARSEYGRGVEEGILRAQFHLAGKVVTDD